MGFKSAFTGNFKDKKKNAIMHRFVRLITLIF